MDCFIILIRVFYEDLGFFMGNMYSLFVCKIEKKKYKNKIVVFFEIYLCNLLIEYLCFGGFVFFFCR